MEVSAIKEMFSDDGDDDDDDDDDYEFTIIKEETLYFYDSESIPDANQHKNSYQDLESVKEWTEATPTRNETPHTEASENKQIQCNRIILGSKPNNVSVDQNSFDNFTKPYQINIVLVDVQSYLQSSKRYCSICFTLFSESSDYQKHYETLHAPKDVPNISHDEIMVPKSIVHECSICANIFTSNLSLRTHIEQNHKAHSVNNANNNNNIEIKRSTKVLCKKTNSNLSNACFHCNETFKTQKFLIDHLYDILQTKRNIADNKPVLKSILFKCHKCDINFVSLQVAKCHSEHMEMLINWKCSICYRIFKKEDDLNHERQHSVSNNFITYNLAEVDVKKILFRCYKCSTHFTENAFLYHFRDCGLATLYPVYCAICDMLLDSTLEIVHESDHCYNDFNKGKLTVIETEVISDNPVDTVNELQIRRKVRELEQICSEVKVVLQRLNTNELYTHMELNIDNNKEIERGLNSFKSSSLRFDAIHNNEESEPRRECFKEMSPESDLVLNYDESDSSVDIFEGVPQKSNAPNFESLETMSPKSDMVLVYDESSSEPIEAAVSKSDEILNNKESEPGIESFESILPCSVASVNISPALNEIINNKEEEFYNSPKSDVIPVVCPDCPESSEVILIESDDIFNIEETEPGLDNFETNSPIIIEISDESESEVNESKSRTDTVSLKSKDTLNNRLTHGRLGQKKYFTNRKREIGIHQRKHVESKEVSNNINRKRALSTDNSPTNNIKRPNPAYFYCETCKCFVTQLKTYTHLQSRCKKVIQSVCTFCGLVFSSTSIQPHKRLHDINKNIKLKNFRFYNIQNRQLIKPPFPVYPKCEDCNVHFVTKSAQNAHTCTEGAYLTCNKCEIRLSEAAFRLHMAFHNYLENDGQMSTEPTFVESINNLDHISNEGKAIENVNLQNSRPECDKTIQSDEEIAIILNDIEIVYTCRNCCVTVDSYDKVVEHCQGHYISEERKIETEKCNICQLNIDKNCYLNHRDLHEKGNPFKVLKFDSYYFPSENEMWIKHVFKTVPKEKVTEILKKSIYRFEGRIKMDIVQQGSPDLTVYKCDQCHYFIEPSSMYKHADNSCFKLRQHPCKICGLPFISAASQTEHEKVHQRPGISMKSYRIVLFNQQQDKQLNSSFYFRKRYVIYLCRNCGGVIDKLQLENHRCDISDLKKCPQCKLLLYSREYEAHANIHEEFDSFNHKNMKVILLGEVKTGVAKVEKTIRSNLMGLIYDYKIYKCKKCHLCVRNENSIEKHSCQFEKQQYKCPKCSLQFSVSRLKTHLRNHERDSFYILSNMTIVTFDPSSYNLNKNTTVSENENYELSDSNTDSDSDIVTGAEEKIIHIESSGELSETVEEKIAKVYKCVCGLHFLNEDSILRHFGVCKSKSKSSKQKCPKCDLLFSTNILFTHLLAHHSNKNRRYKYDIIEMAKK